LERLLQWPGINPRAMARIACSPCITGSPGLIKAAQRPGPLPARCAANHAARHARPIAAVSAAPIAAKSKYGPLLTKKTPIDQL